MNRCYIGSIILLFALLWNIQADAQSSRRRTLFHAPFFDALQWKNLSPARGGRATAVVGFANDNQSYLMGTAGGGLWKTTDAGTTWKNISDGYFKSASVGAIAVAPSNNRVIYVGMGESAIRGVMTFPGDGVYKSDDGGKTWKNIGLWDSQHIAKIVVHPTNEQIVYVAVQGAAFGASEERGVYKTIDGGANWTKVLYYNATTGASDISMDANDPNVLYAAMWDHQRSPWQIRSGGEGSGIYRSTDGGSSWHRLGNGLPARMGKTAVAVSPVNSHRVYALVESTEGLAGVYRSDDGGDTWKQTTSDRETIARAWYYTKIVASPSDEQIVYVLNAPLLMSTDGGASFQKIKTPHSDHHDIWINPKHEETWIVANDGGAAITLNGGTTWSSQDNQPTGQFYRVATDNVFPYHIYSAQQDNTTLSFVGIEKDGRTTEKPFSVGGGESAFIAFDKDHPELIFSGSYQGNITSYNRHSGAIKDIMAYPALGLGTKPKNMKYRFNWNAPIVVDPFDPTIVYHGANLLLKTTNNGLSWEEISPDLTNDDKDKQGVGGFPFTNEAAGGENYNTISYIACSPLQQGVIWIGTDDGNIQLTKDGGATWNNISPAGMGEALIRSIHLSTTREGTAYVAASKHKFNNPSPIILKTTDYGATWKKITNGIGKDDYVMIVREDPKVAGMLYAGTLSGLYISIDNGELWQRFQLNLPTCPITDITFQDNDMIVSTGGRGVWVLKDLNPIQQGRNKLLSGKMQLFEPDPTVRLNYPDNRGSVFEPKPVTEGLAIDYFLPRPLKNGETLTMKILDKNENIVATFSSTPEENYKAYTGGPFPMAILPAKHGINRFFWDMRRSRLPGIEDIFVLGDYRGALVAPGTYTIKLTKGKKTLHTNCQILPDPRVNAGLEDFQEQAEIASSIDEAVRDMHEMVISMNELQNQLDFLNQYLSKIPDTENLVSLGKEISFRITKWKEMLIQPKQKAFQDVINYPNALNAEFIALRAKVESNDPIVTLGVKNRLSDLMKQWEDAKTEITLILERDVAHYNKVYRKKGIPALVLSGNRTTNP